MDRDSLRKADLDGFYLYISTFNLGLDFVPMLISLSNLIMALALPAAFIFSSLSPKLLQLVVYLSGTG